MEELRKLLSFNHRERVAIIAIMVAILVLVLVGLFYTPARQPDETTLHNLDSLLALRQAALDEQRQHDSLVLFPFDPNTMTEEEGRRLGLSESQVRNILNYREKGGRFRIQSDFGRLYTIGEEDYARLEPFIMLPVSLPKDKPNYPDPREKAVWEPPIIPVVDLNSVDSATLVELPQIGPYIARRILAYREQLGGYVDLGQLYEVKGMDSTRYAVAAPYIILDSLSPRQIDVNRDDFRTLLRHPYLSYEQVKRIFNQREQRGMIKNWGQLEALLLEEGEVNPWLEYYVKF